MQPPPGVSLSLMMGPELPVPASQTLVEMLSEAQVSVSDQGKTTFSLTFNADKTDQFPTDYKVLLLKQISVGLRVILTIVIPGQLPHVLVDGFITHLDLSHSKQAGASTITVRGEDVSIKMDREEKSTQFPAMGDTEIVAMILAEYALYGVIPEVMPAPTSMVSLPEERVPQQGNRTDLRYIEYLANKHGYIFMIRPGPAPGINNAYWGPPIRIGVPQPALTVDMGPATNVESISFQYDGLAATLFIGENQDSDTEVDIPVATLLSMRLPPLAAEPALLFSGGLLKTEIYDIPGYEQIDAEALAQSMTDQSVDNVLTAQGEVDTLRYGTVLTCPGLVGLRGCGLSFDGLYTIRSVSHSIKRGEYRQQFEVAREGMMTLIPRVLP